MGTTTKKTLETKIIGYLSVLNENEKKAILSVAETFSREYEKDLSEGEKKELDELKSLHKSGKSKSYTIAEVRKLAHSKLRK